MNSLAIQQPVLPAAHDESLLGRVSAVTRGPLAAAVNRIDHEGHYPLEIMARLGRAGALSAHLAANGERLDLAIAAMHEVASVCGSTGFLTWCHDVCGLYMERSGNPALQARLAAHARGETFGGTALSNPMKTLSGIESMLLRAVPVRGGYEVSGTLPWVSHIGPGQYCGAIASVEGAAGGASRELMFLLDIDERVTLKPCPAFSGMEGTSTWSVHLKRYFVGADQIIADPVQPFLQGIKAAFILLQAGMATGVVQASLDAMAEVEPVLGHVNQFLQDRPAQLQAELDDLQGRVFDLARTPWETDRDFLLAVLDARAQGGELALRASQSALLHQGARGYLMSAAPQRLIREAHFVAIVTPAIKHLRWEMDRLLKEELPA